MRPPANHQIIGPKRPAWGSLPAMGRVNRLWRRLLSGRLGMPGPPQCGAGAEDWQPFRDAGAPGGDAAAADRDDAPVQHFQSVAPLAQAR